MRDAYSAGTEVDIQPGSHWGEWEVSIAGSFLFLRGCPGSEMWEDQVLTTTQRHLIKLSSA